MYCNNSCKENWRNRNSDVEAIFQVKDILAAVLGENSESSLYWYMGYMEVSWFKTRFGNNSVAMITRCTF